MACSRPTRARGLKHTRRNYLRVLNKSRPTRARGLKPVIEEIEYSEDVTVAPHAGAWIETRSTPALCSAPSSVAPHAGAWIETLEK